MKTTNLFIDYLIIGFLAIACITFPYYLIFREVPFITPVVEYQNYILIPILTLALYIIGIIFNQIFDETISLFKKILRTESLENERGHFTKEFSKTYHECLQFIVSRSENAYDYLSFRRSIIRILRAAIVSIILILILYPIYLGISAIKYDLSFSFVNLAMMMIITILAIFLRYAYLKTHIGYYKAISNFYDTLKDE